MGIEQSDEEVITRERSPLRAALAVELARLGITHRELAACLSVPPTTFSTWVTGAHPAPAGFVARIERALRLPAGRLPAPRR